jgi:hypothetical protein
MIDDEIPSSALEDFPIKAEEERLAPETTSVKQADAGEIILSRRLAGAQLVTICRARKMRGRLVFCFASLKFFLAVAYLFTCSILVIHLVCESYFDTTVFYQ